MEKPRNSWRSSHNNSSREIATFKDGSTLAFGRGGKDDWCVYLTRPGVRRHAPRDTDYFQTLLSIAVRHGAEKVYSDFVEIFELTENDVSDVVKSVIRRQCMGCDDRLEYSIVMLTLYAGMVAEINKENTRLGKRIKRLGVHQILVERLAPETAANFSKGKDWLAIAKLCEERGF